MPRRRSNVSRNNTGGGPQALPQPLSRTIHAKIPHLIFTVGEPFNQNMDTVHPLNLAGIQRPLSILFTELKGIELFRGIREIVFHVLSARARFRPIWNDHPVSWPKIETIMSERLRLEPLSVEHAPEMVAVLADTSLYEYTGGEAPSLEQLQRRYAVQAVGHPEDQSQGWFNWIVKAKSSYAPMGFVQATLERNGPGIVANIAWVIAPIHQGKGVASEAATAMSLWLRSKGVDSFAAYVHPEHHASMGVARNQGLHPAPRMEGVEIRWES